MTQKPQSQDRGAATRWCLRAFSTAMLLGILLSHPVSQLRAEQAPVGKVTSFKLDNGLSVVVIEDHRVPVVTHMVWYKIGSIDDPQGASGLAHLLEHLMFKSFDAQEDESYAQLMSRLGAVDNATTRHDTTHYFQRVAKDRLRDVMALETKRMSGLTITDEQVRVERDVVREERRANIESNPIKLLAEEMTAALYRNHSYGRPPIGWSHELAGLRLEDAEAAYKQYYVPANAIVVIAGDVTPDEVRKLAEQTYGTVKAGPQPPERLRTIEPEPIAARRVELADPRVPQTAIFRYYLAPSYRTAEPLQAESIDVLMSILGGGETSRLHRALVNKHKVALGVGARFFGEGRDSGHIALFTIVPGGGDLSAVEARLDEVLAEVVSGGVTEDELARAKAAIEASLIIESDNQQKLATRYGEALAVGRRVEDVEGLTDRILKVTKETVGEAARNFLIKRRSVTGLLKPAGNEGATQ